MTHKKIYELIFVYKELLNCFESKIRQISGNPEKDSLLDDWKQANWELIVESNLDSHSNIFIQPYGNGADYYGDSSRILRPEAIYTHIITCCSAHPLKDRLTGKHVAFPGDGFLFECLVAMRNGWFYEEPPFNMVLVMIDNVEFVFGFEEVRFQLVPAKKK